MKTTYAYRWLLIFATLLTLLSGCTAQSLAEKKEKPNFSAAQKEALGALYDFGGILIQLDEQRPGQPVVAIDFAEHPEFQDAWLNHLLPFPELTTLRLSGTAISDQGLAQLAGCKQLQSLDVRKTNVSPAAVAELRRQLPKLVVEMSPPKLTAQQALLELKKLGGILVHYDDRLPGNPVIMVDAMNHQKFQDEWTRFLPSFPHLRQVGLSGSPLTDAGLESLAEISNLESLYLAETKITDAGITKLKTCKTLRYLDVSGTRVTETGLAALRQALPELELKSEPDQVTNNDGWLDGRPIVPFADPIRRNPPTESGGDAVQRFSAAEIKKWRTELTQLAQLPEATPNGWSKSLVDPTRLLSVFPELRLREGHVLRAYVFKEDANSNGFVWALPAEADFPAPADCPRLESHFLKPPKPFDALDDLMDAIAGDDSPQSYFHASILRRELKEFGGGWHGIRWGMHTVLDDSPWNRPAQADEESLEMYPESKPAEWNWTSPKPDNWMPEVRLEKDKAIVTFYSYTALLTELENGEDEKERIIRHTETYRRGKYRPLIVEKKLAEGPLAVAP